MKLKTRIAALLTAALLLLTTAALADTEITVRAIGQVYVPADTAVINLGVSVRGLDVLKAQSSVNGTIAGIRAALLELGLDPGDINTGYINIWPIYNYSEDMEQLAAYNVSSSLSIRTNEMDKVGAIIDTAFEAGANTLDGINFSCSNTGDAMDQAMRQAAINAMEKAQVYAAAGGMAVSGIKSVTEDYTSVWESGNNVFESSADGKAAAAPTVVQASKICVEANITVTVTAEPVEAMG